MIEINLLRYALAAADTGSFSRAANRFGIKQSTLSKRVHHLETRLGIPLFQRSPRGVVPTLSGNRFLPMARQIISDVDALAGVSRSLARGDAGLLRLGFCGSLAAGDLSAVISSYRKAFPNIELDAQETSRAQLLDKLETGALDVAILIGRSSRAGLRSLTFWAEPLIVALPSNVPMAAQPQIHWSDLRHHGFLVTTSDPGPDIAALIMAKTAAPGYRPSIVAQNVSRDNIAQLGTSDYLPIIAGFAVDRLLLPDTIAYREIHDAAGPVALDQWVHWRAANASPTLKRFLDHLSRRYARPLPTIDY